MNNFLVPQYPFVFQITTGFGGRGQLEGKQVFIFLIIPQWGTAIRLCQVICSNIWKGNIPHTADQNRNSPLNTLKHSHNLSILPSRKSILTVPSAFLLSCLFELPISVVLSSGEQHANAGGVDTDPPPPYPHVDI